MSKQAAEEPLDQKDLTGCDSDQSLGRDAQDGAGVSKTRHTKTRRVENIDDSSGAICLQDQLAERPVAAKGKGDDGDQAESFGDRLIKVEKVASMLDVSVRYVWRLVARRDLSRPVQLGRSCRWVYTEVLAYIEKLKSERDRGK